MIILDRSAIELILCSIATYLQLLEKEEYGALSDFARKHKIPNWMLTRLKNRQAQDSYEPKASTIITILQAMLRDPPMVVSSEELAAQVDGIFPGMAEDISIVFQVANILCYRRYLDKDLLNMFLMLVATLHKQLLDVEKVNPK